MTVLPMSASSSGIRPLLLAFVLGAVTAPGLARAQDDDPLAGFDHDAVRAAEAASGTPDDQLPTRLLIAETQPARAICNRLVDDVNGLAALWEQVRRETLDRETFSFELGEARKLWGDHGAECRLAHRALPQQSAITTLALVWEVGQIEGVWEPLERLGRAWIEEKPRAEVDVAAAVYRDRLNAYGSWLESHAYFWEGAWLDPEQPRSCLDDARQATQQLAGSIRAQMLLPHAERQESELRELAGRRRGIATSIEDCRPQMLAPLQQVELDLLNEQLQSYGQAIDGLRTGDLRRLEVAMEREQELTGRLVRCRAEHAGEKITESCKPATASPPE